MKDDGGSSKENIKQREKGRVVAISIQGTSPAPAGIHIHNLRKEIYKLPTLIVILKNESINHYCKVGSSSNASQKQVGYNSQEPPNQTIHAAISPKNP